MRLNLTGAVRFVALIGVVCALVSCAERTGAGSIGDLPDAAGSSVTTISNSQYPGVVKVIAPGGRGLCTGAFISDRAVLTAAHCTRPYPSGRFGVATVRGVFYTSTVRELGPGVVDDPNDVSILVFNQAIATSNEVYSFGSQIQSGETVRLVGYGCNNLTSRTGAGVKRTGTNTVYDVSDYIELITPLTTGGTRGVLGPVNRAGSCFGDSGGPLFRTVGSVLQIVGIAHAGGSASTYTVSDYVDMNRSDNRGFVATVDQEFGLGIF